jgi:hypothetical protein
MLSALTWSAVGGIAIGWLVLALTVGWVFHQITKDPMS